MRWTLQPSPVMIWAARELLRRPVQTVLLFGGLSSIIVLVAILSLWHQSMTHTCNLLAKASPTLVVRKVDAGGWAPMPADEALTHARRVPGVLKPRTRIWGVVLSEGGTPLTVVGTPETLALWPADVPKPETGQMVAGPGIEGAIVGERQKLMGRSDLVLEVATRLPVSSGMAMYDVVVVHAEDARRLLGLAPEQASDLALDVFREEEVGAVCTDLAAAFPWSVQIMNRQARKTLCLDTAARHGGIGLLKLVPAMVALACLIAAVGVGGHGRRHQMGLLKALGWSGAEILRLQAYGIGMIALCATVAGWGAAYGLLFWPAATGWLKAIFGWSGPAALMVPTGPAALASLAMVMILVIVPFIGIGLWSARGAVLADPGDMLS